MSRILAYAGEAFRSIWLNRTRSILTMLGMIIGTSSVIAVLGISHAASSGINGTINSLGVPPAEVSVDPNQDDPAIASLQYRDVASILNAAPDLVAEAEPSYFSNFRVSANGVHESEQVVSASGYHPDSLTMQSGRRISDEDTKGAAHVATMSLDLAEKFFPATSAVGSFIDINGTRFEIIGVYDPLQGSLFNSGGGNTYMEIPYTTFHHMQPGPIGSLKFYPSSAEKTDPAGLAVTTALGHIHGSRAKYQIQNGAAFVGGFESVINIVAAGLTAIGAVALVVAGIGIMNIMLVSVTERTREIGIRKAIGASRRDIALQFLMEALLLAVGGGATGMIIGILATVGMASLVSKTLGSAVIPYTLVVSVAIGFSITVGMVFGMYPAMRAAKMDPIEALRS
ncbi:MAG: ABC transporter permease [Candidatus Baltobacteraceae bacterium]